jgi:teichuronic acid biosynthesis glycosyltransferase TuaC
VTASGGAGSDEPSEGEARRRLRVLVLARSYPNNVFPNLGLWTARLTERVAETQKVHVVSPVPYFPPLPDFGRLEEYTRFRRVDRRELRHGVDVVRPRFLVGPGSLLYRFEATAFAVAARAVARRIHEATPLDLVHAHFVYPDGAAGHVIARELGVPLVITEHAPWTGWLERPGVRGPALAAAHGAARLIAVSRYVRGSIAAYTGDADRVTVIPNGVDPLVYGISPDAERNPRQILYVGLINYNKGIDILLESMRGVLDQIPDARLLLVGGSFYRNTRLQREALVRYANDLALGDRVSFLGPRPQAEVAALMAKSAVVVLPSRAESFSSVLIEALACGTPVVASRSGGPEDIVDEAVGALVPVEDRAALTRALVGVLTGARRYDPDVLRQYALSNFGWESVSARTLQVYREVTGT